MPEPFKNLLNPALVRRAGAHLLRADAAFDRARFEALAIDGLDTLEMKARAMRIADALEATLPDDFDRAAARLEATLAPPPADEDLSALRPGDDGLAGWILWPFGEYVARRGRATPERALQTLHALTQRFTAEFALRPFIVDHPALVFDTLARWTADPSAHVRRLVSEGSRPRLPWGLQLKSLIADPSPTLPLLAALQDDASAYVRRSVANHLNDIGRDHPGRVADWLERHLPGAPPERRALLRHASRGLVKRGDARVLGAWGLGHAFDGRATLTLAPKRVRLGESVLLTVSLVSGSARPQTLEIDYAVHHRRADGGSAPKVFKGWRIELGPRETRPLERRHSMKPVTTRRYHAGEHRVELRINGATVAEAVFELRLR